MADTFEPSGFVPKKLGKLFKWLRAFFFIYVLSEALVVSGSLMSLLMGSAMFGPEYGFTIGDIILGVGGLLLVIGFIGSIILFCVFSYRSAKNLKNWGVREYETAPGWAVGWYFIPIANLWKPYGVMDQIWSGSQALLQKTTLAPPILGVWWLCWIFTNIISNVSFRMSMRAGYLENYATDVPLYKTTLMLDSVSGVLGIIAALLVLKLLKTIAENQDGFINSKTFD